MKHDAPGVRSNFALAAVCAVLFMTFLDTTIVSVALSDIQSRLHAGVSSLQWVVNGYALTFASLMLIAGSLSDRFGRRKVMLGGLTIFAAGSLLGAVAPNSSVLIGARVIMGVGAAASEPGTLSVIRHIFPDPEDRGLGAWAAVSCLALALGPVIGGALVGLATWRAIFWFNVGATALIIIVASAFVPESADPQAARLDFPGFGAGAAALGALTFGVILGETNGYRAPAVISLFALGVIALVAFVRVERASRAPMLDLNYFRTPAFSGALIVAFVAFFGIFSIFFFTALYLAAVIGYSPYHVAVEFLPMTVAMIVAAGMSGRRVALGSTRVAMAEGCVLAGAGILLSEVLLSAAVPSNWLMATLALAGYGFGTAVVPVTSVTLGVVAPERSGMAASATNTSRELGAVFGVAVLGALVNANLTTGLTNRLHVLKIPANFITVIINAVETGIVPTGVKGGGSGASIEDKVIVAAYAAFRSGLKAALLASGVALIVAAGVAAATLGHRPEAGAANDAPDL